MPYVYQYVDCITNQPFYIGKGSGRRDQHHLLEAKRALRGELRGRRSYCVNKIVSLLKANKPFKIDRIKDNLTHDEAFALEEDLVKKYGRQGIDKDGILTNRDRGGLGGRDYKMSEECRQKLIERNKASKGKPKPGLSAYIAANPEKHISRRQTGMKYSPTRKASISSAQKLLQIGAKRFSFIDPCGVKHTPDDWRAFLKAHNLSYNLIRSKGQIFTKGPNAGWQVEDLGYVNR